MLIQDLGAARPFSRAGKGSARLPILEGFSELRRFIQPLSVRDCRDRNQMQPPAGARAAQVAKRRSPPPPLRSVSVTPYRHLQACSPAAQRSRPSNRHVEMEFPRYIIAAFGIRRSLSAPADLRFPNRPFFLQQPVLPFAIAQVMSVGAMSNVQKRTKLWPSGAFGDYLSPQPGESGRGPRSGGSDVRFTCVCELLISLPGNQYSATQRTRSSSPL